MQSHLTAPPVPAPTTRSFRDEGAWPARAVIACIGLEIFAVASVVAGALHPGYDPLREGISALAATTSPSARRRPRRELLGRSCLVPAAA
jgi:hypothetical protein